MWMLTATVRTGTGHTPQGPGVAGLRCAKAGATEVPISISSLTSLQGRYAWQAMVPGLRRRILAAVRRRQSGAGMDAAVRGGDHAPRWPPPTLNGAAGSQTP